MASVLHDRTNSDSPILQPSKTIRRVQSSRLSRFNLDSDDTFPSEHSSIYDAPFVVSDENGDHEGEIISPLDLQKSPACLPPSPSLENLDQLADLPASHTIQMQEAISTSHSNWPTMQLETITEQRSISTLQTSVSLPRLNTQAIQHFSIDAELDNNASTTQRPSYRHPDWSATKTPFNRRSFSENDASCLHLPTWKGKSPPYKEYQSDSSSSSEELFRTRCLAIWPPYPLKPRYPPVERLPTPPGLPAFGTQEAVELLQVPGTRSAPARHTQGRPSTRPGLPATVTEEVPLPPITPTLRPIDRSNSTKGKSITRRIIHGFCRSSSRELRGVEARRVSLPVGFVARADDGTLVRGRFGARNSGHGVGARPGRQSVGLEGHPFHRLAPAERTLEEEVREIDKACEATERARPQAFEGNVRAGVPLVPECGGPSRTCTTRWQPFWSVRDGDAANVTSQEGAVPVATRIRVASQPEPVTVERTCDGSRMFQRRMSAQSATVAARLEQEEERKHRLETWEARCWNWMRGWCYVGNRLGREESRALGREARRDEFRGSPHMLESEEPGLPNARMVYPTLADN
jgi:hypothetical protein